MPAPADVLVAPEAYLAQERAEELHKREYRDGEVVQMSGVSYVHTRIVANIIRSLGNQLAEGDCEAVSNDLRVRAEGEGGKLFAYPDVVVVCGKPAFLDDAFDTLQNPTLLLEVLSPSAEDYAAAGSSPGTARSILQEYVLVAQDRPLIEHYARQAEGRWLLSEVRGRSEAVELSSIGCRLALDEVYRKVDLAV